MGYYEVEMTIDARQHDSLSRAKPLADPLRIISALLMFEAIVVLIYALVLAIVGTDAGRLWGPLGTACWIFAFALLIRPTGRPNAIYLRAFRTDTSTAKLRAVIAAILGPDFRMSGIRPPSERSSVVTRFALPGLLALKYGGSKFMELEAGEDWMARLWKTYQTTRLVLIDVRELTAYVRQEIKMTLLAVGVSRVVFVVSDDKTEAEWRRLLARIMGPETDAAQIQLLTVSAERLNVSQIDSELRNIVRKLPAGAAGELEPARRFVLDHVSEEVLKSKRSFLVPAVVVATSLVVWTIFGALRSLNSELAIALILVLMLPVLCFLALTIRGVVRAGARARLLGRAGHHQAAKRAWALVLVVTLLALAGPAMGAIQPLRQLLQLRRKADEISAVARLRMLNIAEVTYSSMYSDIGFTCRLSALGGSKESGPPTAEAAQLISVDLASGNAGGYTFEISRCTKAAVNANAYITYTITAVPNHDGRTDYRGFCTDETGQISYDPDGGSNCIAPLQ
jgi:type IV pilus assembly protein PilA